MAHGRYPRAVTHARVVVCVGVSFTRRVSSLRTNERFLEKAFHLDKWHGATMTNLKLIRLTRTQSSDIFFPFVRRSAQHNPTRVPPAHPTPKMISPATASAAMYIGNGITCIALPRKQLGEVYLNGTQLPVNDEAQVRRIGLSQDPTDDYFCRRLFRRIPRPFAHTKGVTKVRLTFFSSLILIPGWL